MRVKRKPIVEQPTANNKYAVLRVVNHVDQVDVGEVFFHDPSGTDLSIKVFHSGEEVPVRLRPQGGFTNLDPQQHPTDTELYVIDHSQVVGFRSSTIAQLLTMVVS